MPNDDIPQKNNPLFRRETVLEILSEYEKKGRYKRGDLRSKFYEKTEIQITYDQLNSALKYIVENILPYNGLHIEIEPGWFTLAQVANFSAGEFKNSFQTRKETNIEQKLMIAQYMWYWLFSKSDITPQSKISIPDAEGIHFSATGLTARSNWQSGGKIYNNLKRKRAELRENNSSKPKILLDSGSTTYRSAEALLKAAPFPFNVQYSGGAHPVEPQIITNSIDIANLVLEYPEQRQNMQMILTGGTLCRKNNSFIGTKSEIWLQKCIDNGNLLKLCVLGITGLKSYLDGLTMNCDNDREKQFKLKSMQACSFRVIVFDSSKFEDGSRAHNLCSIKNDAVDLIIVDEIKATARTKKNIENLMKIAKRENVGVLVVGKATSSEEHRSDHGIYI